MTNTLPPLYSNRWLKWKTKIHPSLKNSISGGVCLIQNKYPPPTPPLSTPAIPHLGPKSKIHSHIFLPCQILSKMVWYNPLASKTIELLDFRQKAWVQARAYPVGTGQGYYHPKVTRHQPSNPWKFHSNWSKYWKVNQQINYHRITLTNQPQVSEGGGGLNQKTKKYVSLKI